MTGDFSFGFPVLAVSSAGVSPAYSGLSRFIPPQSVSVRLNPFPRRGDVLSLYQHQEGECPSSFKTADYLKIMATVSVVRYKRRKKIGDEQSPMVYSLKIKKGDSKLYSIDSLAEEIESIGALSVEDVGHVMRSFIRAMKKVLVAGNRVKVDGLGIFFPTVTCPGVEVEKDCTVKSISRVNIRFKVDNALRLANDSTATTRGGANNVMFELISEKDTAGNQQPTNPDDSGEGEAPDPL